MIQAVVSWLTAPLMYFNQLVEGVHACEYRVARVACRENIHASVCAWGKYFSKMVSSEE